MQPTPPRDDTAGGRMKEEAVRRSPASAPKSNGAAQARAGKAKRASVEGEDELAKSDEDELAPSPDKTASGSRRRADSPGAQSSKRRKVESPKKTSAQNRKPDEPQGSRLSINVPPTGFAAGRDARDKPSAKGGRNFALEQQMSPLFPFDYSTASPAMLEKIAETQQIQIQQEALIAERQMQAAMANSNTRDLRDRGSRADTGGRSAASGGKSGDRLSIVPAAYKRDPESSQANKPVTAPQHHPSVSQQQRMPGAPQTSYPGAPRSGHYGVSMQQQQQRPPSQLPSPHYPPHDPRRDMDRDGEMDRHRTWEKARDDRERDREREREDWAAAARGREMDRERERAREREEWERDYRHGPPSSRPASIGQSGSRVAIAPITVPPLHGNGVAHDNRTIHSPYPLPEPNVPSGAAQIAASRQAFMQPFAQLFDQMHESRHLQSSLHELFRRGEDFINTQEKLAAEMAHHYRRSLEMLGTLQKSVDSVQEMVKHEVSVAREDFNAEVAVWQRRYEELNERVMDRL